MELRVKTDRGNTFSAALWTGDVEALPDWAKGFETDEMRFHGTVLKVGPYLVRTGRWLLRSDDERREIFPVPDDMFGVIYSPVDEELPL